ncbi:putative reverse transcriptase, RNA-dependent DNA polymerase [Tanacetum coccineum]|uniref:Reverse transcriptase, RNA-dependent DNA polymerase n=1 Tax=Tanacetum coccineum TaxID=301880 RepID=A0ABQ5DII3_9ASTR
MDQTFDRLQKLISQLEIQGEVITQEDMNLKLLKSLPSEWKTHALIWRNKEEIKTISLDNLYNNLKIYEPELIGSSSISQNSSNVFCSLNSSFSNSSIIKAYNTAYGVSAAHTQSNPVNSTSIDNLSDAVICAFLASQPNSPQLAREDLEQIDRDDLEEMDLHSKMAMLTIRARRFIKRTGRKLDINGQRIGFDRENGRRTVTVETPTENALIAQDKIGGYDWSYQAEEEHPTNFALIAYTSSGSSSNSDFESNLKLLGRTALDLQSLRIGILINDERCSVTILNNQGSSRQVDGKDDTEFLLGNGPNWFFDVDSLSKSMNYVPVVARNQTNGIAGTRNNIVAGPKDNEEDARVKPTEVDESEASDKDGKDEQDSRINAAKTSEEHLFDQFSLFKNAFTLSDVPNVSPIDDNTEIFAGAYDDEDVGGQANLNSLETTMNKQECDSALVDPRWIEECEEELYIICIRIQKVWTLVDLPDGKRAIGTKWVFRNKKDKRGIVVRNKARLVAQGYTQEEGIDYDEVFVPVARIVAIRLFFTYASYMGFIVYQMDVKSAFLCGTIEEELLRALDDVQEIPDEFYGGAHLLLRSMIGSLMYLTASMPDITFAVCACARFKVTPKTSHPHAMKSIFRHLKCQPNLGLCYHRDSPFNLEAFSDSDYTGASLDRKSTTRGVVDPKSNA